MQIIKNQKNSNHSNNMREPNKTNKRNYSILFKSTHPLITQKIYGKEPSPKNKYEYDRTKYELSRNLTEYSLILDEQDLIIKNKKQINIILQELKKNLAAYLKDINLKIVIQPRAKTSNLCKQASIDLILSIFKYIQDNYTNCNTLFLSDFINPTIDDNGITDLDRVKKILHNQLWIKKLVLNNNTYLENGNSNSIFHMNHKETQNLKKFILENTKIQTIECLDKNQHLNKKLGLTSPNKTKQEKHNNLQYLFYIIAQGQNQDKSRGKNNCLFKLIDKQTWLKINSYIMFQIPWDNILYDICLYKTKSSIIEFRAAEPVTYPIRITLDDPITILNTLEMRVIKDKSKKPSPDISEYDEIDINKEPDINLSENIAPNNTLTNISTIDYQTHLQNTLSVLKYTTRSVQNIIKNTWDCSGKTNAESNSN